MKTKISLLLLSLLFVFSEMKAQDKITIGVIQYDLSDIDKSFKELHDQGFGSCELNYQKKVYTKDFAEKVQGLYNHSVIFLWDWMRLPLLCGKHYRYNSPAPLRRTA